MENKAIFLGGTCNGSNWRDELIPNLTKTYFNPVVKKWNELAQTEEVKQRAHCEICLYVITPKLEGYFSIAEVVDDSNKRPEKTVFYVWEADSDIEFTPHQKKSLNAVGKMVEENGALWAKSIEELIAILNS